MEGAPGPPAVQRGFGNFGGLRNLHPSFVKLGDIGASVQRDHHMIFAI
jgi:hypothetical protein